MNIKEQREISLSMLKEYSSIINRELENKYEFAIDAPDSAKKLYEAQKYSLMAGGKRIRPALVLEVCAAFGGDIKSRNLALTYS